MVLHGVIRAAREESRDQGPLIALELIRCKQTFFLFLRERAPVDARVKLIEPP